MREIDVFLKSLVNVDRATVLAVLSAEAQTAAKLGLDARRRTTAQRARRQQAIERAARLDHIQRYFRDGRIHPDMTEKDLQLCRSLREKLRM